MNAPFIFRKDKDYDRDNTIIIDTNAKDVAVIANEIKQL